MKLDGKVIVVTGASSGMGRAISSLFAEEGGMVVAVARRINKLEELEADAEDKPGTITPLQGDVSEDADLDHIIDFTIQKYGKIDILVNNAGIMDDFLPGAEVTDEMWERVLKVNLTAPMKLIRRALPYMINQKKGNIVIVASLAGLYGSRAGTAYTVAKHGLIGLMKNTAFMYFDQGIRCNAICPGGVNTEINDKYGKVSELGVKKSRAGMGAYTRTGEADEIAAIALFLASEDSSFINGDAIVADAGWTAY